MFYFGFDTFILKNITFMSSLIYECVCLYIHGQACAGHVQNSEDRLKESVLSYWVDPKGRALVIHLGDWIL